jgi:hypothetical protein
VSSYNCNHPTIAIMVGRHEHRMSEACIWQHKSMECTQCEGMAKTLCVIAQTSCVHAQAYKTPDVRVQMRTYLEIACRKTAAVKPGSPV